MKHRLFFAIQLPPAASLEVIAWQKKLDKLELPVVWEDPEKMHMTLNFLGNKVESEQLTPVRRTGFNAAAGTPKFEMQLNFLETLYQRHQETLIYLAPVKEPVLLDLQNRLCIGLNEIELDQPRKFLPHIMIGWLKRTDPVTTKECIQKISNFEFKPLKPFTVENITLYESYVSSKGSHYQKIGEFMLQS